MATALLVGSIILVNMQSVSTDLATKTSGDQGGVTIVLLVHDGMDCQNVQQISKSTFGGHHLSR